ncbi:MAG: hypothetical protein D6767_03010 [Candidatus Hydrogenedentota bacterium]|nr:MAG: hypothetical protein D6767_03010 [Candidatus Hydrogenedentota bacterium]
MATRKWSFLLSIVLVGVIACKNASIKEQIEESANNYSYSQVTYLSAQAGDGQIRLTWVNPTFTTFAGVKVIRKTGSAPVSVNDGTLVYDGTGTSYTDTGLTNGTEYYYAVFTYDNQGNYSQGVTVGATPQDAAPDNVSNLTITVGESQLTLSWTNPSNSDFAGVKVVRKTGGYAASVSDGTLVYDGTGTTFTDTGLTNGTQYYYSVFSYDMTGNLSPGAVINAKPVDTTPPGDVTNVNVVDGDTRVTINWDNPADTDFKGVRVMRTLIPAAGANCTAGEYPSSPTDPNAIQIPSSVTGSTGSITDTGLANNKTYCYTIYAYDNFHNFAGGITAQGKPYPGPPADVTGATATAGDSQIVLTWTNPPDADFAGVIIVRKTTGYPTSLTDGTQIYDSASATITSYSDLGLTNNTTYYYTIFAYDNDPMGPFYAAGGASARASATPTDLTPPGNVTSLTATPADSQITLTWTNPTDPDFAGVVIVRKTTGFPANISDGIQVYNGSSTSFTDTGLINGQTYYYTVFAYDNVAPTPNYASGSSTSSAPINTNPPGNVTGFTATSGNTQIVLSWTNPTDSDFSAVKILFKTAADGTCDTEFPANSSDGTLIYDSNGTTYTHTGLTNGTAYCYGAFAYDTANNYASGSTASAIPADTTPPAEVSGFTATAGDFSISLSWTNPTDPDFAGVKLVRKLGGFPANSTDGTLVYNGTNTSYFDNGLLAGTTYYYTIFTYDTASNESSGSQASATPPTGVPLTPSWAKLPTNTCGDTYYEDMAVDSSGNVYVVGAQVGNNPCDYGNGVVLTGPNANATDSNAFILKFNSSGVAQWGTIVNTSPAASRFLGVDVNSTGTQIVVVGMQVGTSTYQYDSNASFAIAGQSAGSNPIILTFDGTGSVTMAKTLTAGSSGNIDGSVFYEVKLDGSNAVAVGFVYNNGTYEFDPGPPSAITITGLVASGTGKTAALVVYNLTTQKAVAAATLAAASSDTEFKSVAVDSASNIYVVGTQNGTTTFDYGNSVTLTGVSGTANAVLIKYNSALTAQWGFTPSSTGTNSTYFNDIYIDASDNIYVVGQQTGNSAFTYGIGTTVNLTGVFSSGFNATLLKLDTTGAALWGATPTAGSNSSVYNGVYTDASGNVYVAGEIYGTQSFTFGTSVSATGAYSNKNAVIVKYDSAGTALRARTVFTSSNKTGFAGIVVSGTGAITIGQQDGTTGVIYVPGTTVNGVSTGTNAVLTRYD